VRGRRAKQCVDALQAFELRGREVEVERVSQRKVRVVLLHAGRDAGPNPVLPGKG